MHVHTNFFYNNVTPYTTSSTRASLLPLLQFYVSISEHVPPATLGLQPGSPLLSSIKQCVVELARSSSVIDSIQSAAQAALRTGWSLLLPTVSERASTLSQLLPARDGGFVCFGLSSFLSHHTA